VTVPVRHLGEELGRIELRLLAGGALNEESQDLLADLAAQAGVALHNVRLTVELRARLHELEQRSASLDASRSRLVTASTGERQRLERRIADQVQPHLAALSAGLPAVERLLDVPEQAGRALEPLVAEATAALEALREVAHGVYPPLLVDHGLLPAVEAAARGARVPVRVAVEDPAGVLSGDRRVRYPAPTEAAAYFCLLDVLSAAQPRAGSPTGGVEVLLRAEPERLEVTVAGAEPTPDAVAAAQDRAGARGGDVRLEPGPHPTVVIALPAQVSGSEREAVLT
jgi:signal transduction histidine kinase